MSEKLTPLQEIIKAFKKTRWWKPLVLRYKAHLDACEQLECPELIEPFPRFIDEIMNAPEAVRDDMLEIKPVEPYEPPRRYPAYIEPTKAEQKLDFYSAAMERKLR